MVKGSHLKILIAEDDPVSAKILAHLLLQQGNWVKIASNGKQALRMIHQEEFQALLTDWHMEDMDGVTLAKTIRHKLKNHNLIIVMVTGDPGFNPDNPVHSVGKFDFVLNKPYRSGHVTDLLGKMEHELQNRTSPT